MTVSPVEWVRQRKRPSLQGLLRPPGSFADAFAAAAEEMKKTILQLKEGKTDSSLLPCPGYTQLENPSPESRNHSVQSPGGLRAGALGGQLSTPPGPLCIWPRPFDRGCPVQLHQS